MWSSSRMSCNIRERGLILFDKIPVPTIELPNRRFQTFLDISLSKKLIRKSHRPQNKPFIRGASPGVSYKRDDFNFHITNFLFLSGNIPSSPAFGVFISQIIRYARACSSYECFILRAMRLSNKLLWIY